MAEDHASSDGPVHQVFNAAGRVAENIINYFIVADWAMGNNDLKLWWEYLDKAYMQAEFSFKEKDRTEMENLWKIVTKNLYSKYAYSLLKEYHLKLRRLCTKFFTMGEGMTGPAIWRR